MQTYGSGMDLGTQYIISAYIGGTVEVLCAGKFANGAVTGAYVMINNYQSTIYPKPLSLQHEVPGP